MRIQCSYMYLCLFISGGVIYNLIGVPSAGSNSTPPNNATLFKYARRIARDISEVLECYELSASIEQLRNLPTTAISIAYFGFLLQRFPQCRGHLLPYSTTLEHRMVSLLQRFSQFRGHMPHCCTTLGHRIVSLLQMFPQFKSGHLIHYSNFHVVELVKKFNQIHSTYSTRVCMCSTQTISPVLYVCELYQTLYSQVWRVKYTIHMYVHTYVPVRRQYL